VGRVLRPLARLESGFVGEVYESVIRRPVLGVALVLRAFDRHVVDALLEGLGAVALRWSQALRSAASGHAQHYGLFMAAGIVVLLVLAVIGP
jgi:hypothetical protein